MSNIYLPVRKWPYKIKEVVSDWRGFENYMLSIVDTFKVTRNSALEFGVGSGYSTDILSKLFNCVVGVDGYIGARDSQEQRYLIYENVYKKFNDTNVELVRKSHTEYIKSETRIFDLIHVDLGDHPTDVYECTEWSVQHSNVVILPNTYSCENIDKVCTDISTKFNITYFNVKDGYGLGILYRQT